MKCAKCGTTLEIGTQFCGECGSPAKVAVTPVVEPSPEPAGIRHVQKPLPPQPVNPEIPVLASRRGGVLWIGGIVAGSAVAGSVATYLLTRGTTPTSPDAQVPAKASTLAIPTKAPMPVVSATTSPGIPVGTAVSSAAGPTAPRSVGPRKLVVDTAGGGDYRSIQEAVLSAGVQDTIVLRSGWYRESVVIGRDVRISGEGGRTKVVVEGVLGASVFVITAGSALLSGMSIRYTGPDVSFIYFRAVDVTAGAPVIEDCDLMSAAGAALSISGASANPTVRNCTLRDSAYSGVNVSDQARGTIERCQIFGNSLQGIAVSKRGNPVVRECIIRDNMGPGVNVWDQGTGSFVANSLFGNAKNAWQIDITAGQVTRTGNLPNF